MSFIPVLIILFGSIILHELSHSIVALNFGLNVKKIILLPIGGMAVIDESHLNSFEEFLMSIVGPLFNFFVCGITLLLVSYFSVPIFGYSDWNLAFNTPSANWSIFLVSSVFWLNYMLGAFNLFVPAIPLDGGRVFRSVLAMYFNKVKATRIASKTAKLLAILLFFFGVLGGNWLLAIIAVFIFLGANAELEHALSEQLLKKFPLKTLIRDNYLLVTGKESLEKVIKDMVEHHCLVAFIKTPIGFSAVSLYTIKNVARSMWKKTRVKDIAISLPLVDLKNDALFAFEQMNKMGIEVLPVKNKNGLVGVVFKEDIQRVFEVLKVVKQ